MMPSKVLTAFLLLLFRPVFGQDAEVCNCGEISERHEQCVRDWSALDHIRQTLEQQVRDTEFQANDRCNNQIEKLRGEILAQGRGEVEQVQNEMKLVRSESQAQLEQLRNENQAQLEETKRNTAAELSQCQTQNQKVEEAERKGKSDLLQCQSQHKELNSQFEEQGNTHRRLQKSSQQLEETLASIKSEKSKLEKSVSSKDVALNKAKKDKNNIQRELDQVKSTLDEMIASKTIITIDWDLLDERIEELKAKAAEATQDFASFVQKHLEMAKEKVLEFYKYLETQVYPQVKETMEKDVIPVVKKSWKQAQELWEDIYSPYRPTVNQKIKLTKQESKKFYRENLEPAVKEYKIDVYAAEAKQTAKEYMILAHNNLVEGVKTGTGVALNFVKLEEGPDFAVNALEKVHADYELVAYYIECFFAFLVAYFVLKMLFGGKKKKGKKRMTKKEWEAKQQKEAGSAKGKQQQNKKNMKNGHKNSKKNK